MVGRATAQRQRKKSQTLNHFENLSLVRGKIMFVVTRFCGERRARYTHVLLLLLLLALEERKECPIITTRGSGDVIIPKPIS